MEIEYSHPILPLIISEGRILGPDGVVGYVDYGKDYIYVCIYDGKLVVAEYNTFDSILSRTVEKKIRESYYYAFKILCAGGVTAVVKWVSGDVVLVGAMYGYLENGERIWKDAAEISSWPGLKELK